MKIMGLQKLTLLDFPGRLACTVFLGGCNLRCPFCHNPSLVLPDRLPPPLMNTEDLLLFLKSRIGKLTGVCITGGEPTLHSKLPDLIRQIRDLGFAIKLDTNGSNPQMLSSLLKEGLLTYVAMDIKNDPDGYVQTCGGIDIVDRVKESAELLMNCTTDYEFRTTVCAPLHTPERLEAIGRWLTGAKAYYLQQFVDSGDLLGSGMRPLTTEELENLHKAVLPYIKNTSLRGI